MADWGAFGRELDAWADIPGGATFWWRDDDLCRPGPNILRLLNASTRHDAPVLLAVIPQSLEDGVAALLADRPQAWVAQHGWAHQNHASPTPSKSAHRQKKIELGGTYSFACMRADLLAGWSRLSAALPGRLLPVMVPPWNRIDPAVAAALPDWGYRAWSGFGPRDKDSGAGVLNTHIDVINWRGDRGFAGEDAVLGQAIAHLGARRKGDVDATEATGLLTHHAVHDPATWAFLAGFVEAIVSHPHAGFQSPRCLFPAPGPGA